MKEGARKRERKRDNERVLRECLFKDTYSSKLSQILNKQYLTGEYLDRIQITDAPDKRMQKIAYRVAKTQCQ